MTVKEYNAQTGQWTEYEIPDPEPIPELDMTPRAEDNYAEGELFQAAGEFYKALTDINIGDNLIIGTNYEPVDLIKLLNEQNDELKAVKMLLGIN